MANFAQLDSNNIVTNVLTVSDDTPANGTTLGENSMHVDGETYLQNLYKGGVFKQTSFSGSFRGQYAGIGDTYDAVNDVFISPQPYSSWSLDGSFKWQPPTAVPGNDKLEHNGKEVSTIWDEPNTRWVGYNSDGSTGDTPVCYWDPDTSSWNSL